MLYNYASYYKYEYTFTHLDLYTNSSDRKGRLCPNTYLPLFQLYCYVSVYCLSLYAFCVCHDMYMKLPMHVGFSEVSLPPLFSTSEYVITEQPSVS